MNLPTIQTKLKRKLPSEIEAQAQHIIYLNGDSEDVIVLQQTTHITEGFPFHVSMRIPMDQLNKLINALWDIEDEYHDRRAYSSGTINPDPEMDYIDWPSI